MLTRCQVTGEGRVFFYLKFDHLKVSVPNPQPHGELFFSKCVSRLVLLDWSKRTKVPMTLSASKGKKIQSAFLLWSMVAVTKTRPGALFIARGPLRAMKTNLFTCLHYLSREKTQCQPVKEETMWEGTVHLEMSTLTWSTGLPPGTQEALVISWNLHH